MTDFMLGLLMAIPIYGIILLLTRDILINHFVNKTLIAKIPNDSVDQETVEKELSGYIITDTLVSYRLLLILEAQLKYFLKTFGKELDADELEVLNSKLKQLTEAIAGTEIFFKQRDVTDYLKIKEDIKNETKDIK